jgi:hypothetical protein
MTPFSTKALILSFAAFALASQACTLASPTEVKMVPKDDTAGTSAAATDAKSSADPSGASDAAMTCSAKFTKPDLSTLTACGNGKGHCAVKANMTTPMQKFFGPDTCKDGQVCVDDEFIKAGGSELKKCTSSLAGAGRCVVYDLNAPMVADGRGAVLKTAKSECDAGLTCVPCVDPTNNNADTGICHPAGLTDGACSAAGSDTTSAAPAAPAAECCGGKGQCMLKSGMPNGAGDKMEQDTCADANVCAPKALVAGQASKCTTMLMSGICLGGCFNSMLEKVGEVGLLRQGDCADAESCVPCSVIKKFIAGDGTPVPGCE